MATPGINTKVKMDGEKEYRAALAQINAGLKNLGAEMRATEQDFADNADSVEALTAKGDVLTRQMQTQQEKVDTLREVLQKAGESYGEADKRTIDWKTTLIDAETKLKQMQEALEDAPKIQAYIDEVNTRLNDYQSIGLPEDVKEYATAIAEKYAEVGGTFHLDFAHTVFGQVIDGMKVVDDIANVRTARGDRPLHDVTIDSIDIIE